jgi:hypothetical protein
MRYVAVVHSTSHDTERRYAVWRAGATEKGRLTSAMPFVLAKAWIDTKEVLTWKSR